jgi:hypothetical protein
VFFHFKNKKGQILPNGELNFSKNQVKQCVNCFAIDVELVGADRSVVAVEVLEVHPTPDPPPLLLLAKNHKITQKNLFKLKKLRQ